MRLGFVKSVAGIAAVLGVAGWVSADTYSFFKLTNNGNPNVASQLLVDVTDAGGGLVDFKFTNNVGIASSITDIYFDDGTLLAIASISSSAGVAFDDPATPGNLPGGNTASPPFVTTAGFSADSDSPVVDNGVNASTEWVTIQYSLQGGQTFADTIAALGSGALRIGLHVQGIGTPGGSDSYINGNVVPLPAAAWMGMALMGSVGGYGFIRKRRAANAE